MAGSGVTALVLAAGESRRMGRLKPLLPYGPATVIQTVVRSLKASPVERVRVVLGHRSDEIAAVLAPEGVETVLNPRYPEGMLTSVQAGLADLPSPPEWLLVALGDQPALAPSTVTLLVDTARALHAADPGIRIFIPTYDGRRGHPLVLRGEYRDEILGLPPEGGLRELLLRHPGAIREVPVPTGSILEDMDTPEEYERHLRRLREDS